MGWGLRILVSIAIVVFLVGCVWLGYALYAGNQGNEYVVQVTAAFNAAALVNGEETCTEADRAVISAYEGRRYVILPENYKAIVSLLRKDHAMPMFRRVREDAPLSIAICACAELKIEPDEGSVDGTLISFTTDTGKRYTMHIRGGNIWKQLIDYTTTGRPDRRNLPL